MLNNIYDKWKLFYFIASMPANYNQHVAIALQVDSIEFPLLNSDIFTVAKP